MIVEGGYIRVVQDVRGKYGSEGDYVMNRPLRGPQNPTAVDHATDTWDTIDWLVKNVPESNGRVGILGISYDGFLPLMALVDPHPALKVAVPMNPMVDGWRGDDWFHHGAFRQQNMPYIYDQVATRENEAKWWSSHYDDYDMYLEAGSAGELGRRRGLEQLGFWRKLLEHPAYDAFWRDQAVDRLLAARPLEVPVMLVHSLWDQEDIYGAPAVYRALEPKDRGNDKVFLVMGPWYHGQMIGDGSALGALRFGSDTALDLPARDAAPVPRSAPEGRRAARRRRAGDRVRDRHQPLAAARRLARGCGGGCPSGATPLYLARRSEAPARLRRRPAAGGARRSTEFVSDPAKPVPYRARPIQPMGYGEGSTWSQWLVDDQREASGRPDVARLRLGRRSPSR